MSLTKSTCAVAPSDRCPAKMPRNAAINSGRPGPLNRNCTLIYMPGNWKRVHANTAARFAEVDQTGRRRNREWTQEGQTRTKFPGMAPQHQRGAPGRSPKSSLSSKCRRPLMRDDPVVTLLFQFDREILITRPHDPAIEQH